MAEAPPPATQLESAVHRVSVELSRLISVLTEAVPSDVAHAIAVVESAGRLMDAARVRVLLPLAGNSRAAEQLGYTSAVTAAASLARVSERSARARLAIASAVCPNHAITGAPLPAPHELVGEALNAGHLGLDAGALICAELASVASRVPADVLDAAESIMVTLASTMRCDSELVSTPVSVEYLAGEIRQVTARIDPDGARPREQRARRRRGLRIGAQDDDGLIPLSGRLLPEIGVLFAGLIEAWRRSPRFQDPQGAHLDGPDRDEHHRDELNRDELKLDSMGIAAPLTDAVAVAVAAAVAVGIDLRTPDQRRHDAFGEILMAAAAAERSPRLDGQAVTVIVTVAADDLSAAQGREGDPIGIMAGSRFPVSRREASRFIDAGGYRTVAINHSGTAAGISSVQRCFTPAQRLAIAARDGYRCATPGCTSPHYTLQAHHVIPDRDGGPTSTGNGILLCFWHHQQVDSGPWQYRTVSGVPQVRGPGILDWVALRRLLRPPLRPAA